LPADRKALRPLTTHALRDISIGRAQTRRVDSRHERGSESLEEERNEGSHRRDVASKAADEGQETSEERDSSEKERDQVEGKHEARQVEVLMGPDELLRDALLCPKVSWGIKGQGRDDSSAIGIVPGCRVCSTDGEKGPSRRVARVADAVGRGLEKVEAVERRAVDASSQDREQLQQNTASDEDQRYNREKWSCVALAGVNPCAYPKLQAHTSWAHCDVMLGNA
jgi:hypothetical protein